MWKWLFVLLLTTSNSWAQNTSKKLADYTLIGNFCIPNVVSSQMFNTSFDGIYNLDFSLNRRLNQKFYIGLGYQNYLFQNDKALKFAYFNASIPYNTRLMGHGAFLRFNYVNFINTIAYVSYAMNGGLMNSHYFNINSDTSKANQPYGAERFNSVYLQPEFAINFVVDKTLSFGLVISYTTLFDKFDPKAPRFNQFSEISSKSNNYFMSWINFGFGFNVLLNSKK